LLKIVNAQMPMGMPNKKQHDVNGTIANIADALASLNFLPFII